ncbi:FAD binding domain-containing protein [Cohnella lubricantis]|uniref:FAD binding domain-containing protein n=1 Tax=Cohnella lubricantis TaxID=2163172 RepID=A0A841TEF5_9BACL|nr:FAD binding domain-containing protein [Cohnella lubricantis]MBB6678445.1 FAD binding domain-containing protein [Cohnella lubricantis]MBP2116825.1 xanthine dehydrogenase molybdenum-binding subunit [Cohnella lubricantis]
MIGFDFDYYRPSSIEEAVSVYQRLEGQGRHPVYLSGSTEFITFARVGLMCSGAVIDLKGIPECRMLAAGEREMTFGAALTLSELDDSKAFPLLGDTGAGIADRTSRNKITLGGNVCSRLIYKEAVLPLLLTDSDVVVAGSSGIRRVPISRLFDREMRLGRGEFLVQFIVGSSYRSLPYASVKKRKASAIDYPVVTVTALAAPQGVRYAFSGLCAFPFRSEAVERALNERGLPPEERIRLAAGMLPEPILSDVKASADYRELVWRLTLTDVMEALES